MKNVLVTAAIAFAFVAAVVLVNRKTGIVDKVLEKVGL